MSIDIFEQIQVCFLKQHEDIVSTNDIVTESLICIENKEAKVTLL